VARKYLDKQDLINKVNNAIKEHKSLEKYFFNGLYTIHGYDRNGCNWNISFLTSREVNTALTTPLIKSIIEEHQDQYNIFTSE